MSSGSVWRPEVTLIQQKYLNTNFVNLLKAASYDDVVQPEHKIFCLLQVGIVLLLSHEKHPLLYYCLCSSDGIKAGVVPREKCTSLYSQDFTFDMLYQIRSNYTQLLKNEHLRTLIFDIIDKCFRV